MFLVSVATLVIYCLVERHCSTDFFRLHGFLTSIVKLIMRQEILTQIILKQFNIKQAKKAG